ncbi:MAG: hypothetical protein IJH04_02825, partial [Eggerthellaceae bacterium]|nr:hypothetical protein [Eggerthellaceae bacterium]
DPTRSFVYRAASRSSTGFAPDALTSAVQTESLFLDYMRPVMNQKPYIVTDYSQESDHGLEDLVPESYYSSLIVKIPLVSQAEVVGVLTLIFPNKDRSWFDENQEWLGVIGNQLGILMSQMQETKNNVAIALLRERERMSQEIHDNLSQYVGTIRMLADKLSQDWQTGKHDEIGEDIAAVSDIAKVAYACIRDELVGLRFATPERDIESMVGDYLVRFQKQWGINTVFSVIDPNGVLQLSPLDEMQVFRILQESLTNIRRHAKASNVSVSLETNAESVRMLVIDDGIGFSLADVSSDKMGLAIMKERAADMGGSLKVVSAPGEGTILKLEVPMSLVGAHIPRGRIDEHGEYHNQ